MPAALFFLKIALAIWGLLWFCTNLRIVFSVAVKHATGILIRIPLGSMGILTALVLLTHTHRISVY